MRVRPRDEAVLRARTYCTFASTSRHGGSGRAVAAAELNASHLASRHVPRPPIERRRRRRDVELFLLAGRHPDGSERSLSVRFGVSVRTIRKDIKLAYEGWGRADADVAEMRRTTLVRQLVGNLLAGPDAHLFQRLARRAEWGNGDGGIIHVGKSNGRCGMSWRVALKIKRPQCRDPDIVQDFVRRAVLASRWQWLAMTL